MLRWPLLGTVLLLSQTFVSLGWADAGTTVGTEFLQEECALGDPMCVRKKDFEAKKPEASKPVAKPETKPAEVAKPASPSPAEKPAQAPTAPAGAPVKGVSEKKTADGWSYTFDGSKVDGRAIRPDDSIMGRTDRPKILLSDELECQLPKEVTDSYGFDRKKCEKVEAEKKLQQDKELGRKLADQVVATGECPKDFNDLNRLKLIYQVYQNNPFEVDHTPLIAKPIRVESPDLEAHLPMACGYNSWKERWYRSHFFCSDSQICNGHSSEGRGKDDSTLVPVEGAQDFVWRSWSKRLPSWREGGLYGDHQLVPLGDGVFLETFKTNQDPFYYGLLIVPKKANFERLACEKKKMLKEVREMMGQAAAELIKGEIKKHLMQAEALDQLQKVTQLLGKFEKTASPEVLERFRKKADHLNLVVQGKEHLEGFKMGKLVCPGDAEVSDRRVAGARPIPEVEEKRPSVKSGEAK